MHIMDGVVTNPLLIGATACSLGLVAYGLKRIQPDDVPKIALLAAAFFVASVIRVPIGPTAAHLMLTGLLGLVLGPAIFPALLAGLLLQTLIFGFGGISVIGLNLLNMSLPGYAAYLLFQPVLRSILSRGTESAGNQHRDLFLVGFGAGCFALLGSVIMVALSLVLSGQEFIPVAKFMVIANAPVMIVEGLVVGVALRLLALIKPELFYRPSPAPLSSRSTAQKVPA